MVAERFSFVKYGQKEHWAVRLWRTALFAEANEAQLWSSLNRPGFAGGSNFQIGWSHDEQNDEQVFP